MTHPYRSAPARAFWNKAVARNFDASEVPCAEQLLRSGDRVGSAGSCFAANLVPWIERAGFEYVRTERRPSVLGAFAEDNFSYAKFSAAYGNLYTVRHAVQLLLRALGRFQPVEDRWVLDDGRVIDAFRPGLRHAATSHSEFELLTRFHLARVLDAFREATVFVLTLGLTEAWVSTLDGAVFPACPGTVAGTFDADKHAFHNFDVREVTDDLDQWIALARELNPDLRLILTVSPVPLVATATGEHVLSATTYSKSVLRVAAAEAVRRHAGCLYFPAYELVTGPQAPHDFFESDRRAPTERAIDTVMRAFLNRCERPTPAVLAAHNVEAKANQDQLRQSLSRQIAAAVCEEEASQH